MPLSKPTRKGRLSWRSRRKENAAARGYATLRVFRWQKQILMAIKSAPTTPNPSPVFWDGCAANRSALASATLCPCWRRTYGNA